MDSAHQSKWTIGEVVFGIPFLLAVGLEFIFPYPLATGTLRTICVAAGITLVVFTFWLVPAARREMAHYQQPTDPGQPTTHLVKTGPFAYSRNPLYLAAVLLFLGFSLTFNLLYGIVAVVLSTILCHFILIMPEESYLTEHFGQEYLEYQSSVQRWIGRKST
jgi:protein-S-isoprenylcysteine O-methyltransferase Ste14